ncbi:MAG TPA: CopG family transcriptional regulator [Anaerolineae bacterium]|nr:CopG family transcriptional regulator [Anaerolineae bacterium]
MPMTHQVTVTLDEDAYTFLKAVGGNNHSAFVNQLLKQAQRRHLAAVLLAANEEEVADQQYQQAFTEWDTALLDGLATAIL